MRRIYPRFAATPAKAPTSGLRRGSPRQESATALRVSSTSHPFAVLPAQRQSSQHGSQLAVYHHQAQTSLVGRGTFRSLSESVFQKMNGNGALDISMAHGDHPKSLPVSYILLNLISLPHNSVLSCPGARAAQYLFQFPHSSFYTPPRARESTRPASHAFWPTCRRTTNIHSPGSSKLRIQLRIGAQITVSGAH